jgi:ABC-type transport system substrate-binding protein
MAIDRDLFIQVEYNVDNYRQAGIDVETRWNSALPANFFTGWWLDPQSKDFGENAKYFQHDIAEAKKLMAAAGYPNGVDVVRTSAPDNYGAKASKDLEVITGMASEIGFRYTDNIVGYNTGYQPQYRDASGNFDGETHRSVIGSATDAVELLLSSFSTAGGSTFVGADVNGKGDFSGDPRIDQDLKSARAEVDADKRRTIVQDLQRYLAKQQYMIRYPGGATGLSLEWPGVRNYRVFRGPGFSFWGPGHYVWLDDTLPPFKKA